MAAACDESQWQLKDRLAAVCCNDGRQTRSSRPRLAGDVAGEPRSSWRLPLVVPDQRPALQVVHERLLGGHVAWPVTGVAGRGGALDPLVAAAWSGGGRAGSPGPPDAAAHGASRPRRRDRRDTPSCRASVERTTNWRSRSRRRSGWPSRSRACFGDLTPEPVSQLQPAAYWPDATLPARWCARDRPQSGSGGLDRTPAAMPPRAVRRAAATGETMAPMGSRVGSDPVTYTGRAMLSTVAIPQITVVATARLIQNGCRTALPRSLPIPQKNAPVATRPQNQAPKAPTGRCCCSLPVTMSGANKLISVTATQIAAIPARVHATQEPSAVAGRRFDPDAIVLLPGQSWWRLTRLPQVSSNTASMPP